MVSSIWTPLLLVSASVLCVSSDFLMGGHLDNKKVSDDTLATSHLLLARTAEDSDMDLIAEESGSSIASTPYPDQEPRYKIPYAFAFNGGKPFSLEKDPITGKIDFEKTPPLKALNLTESYQNEEEGEDTVDGENDETARIDEGRPYGKIGYLDSKRVVSTNSKNERIGPNEINPYSPSFHDFLNLPVKYSSEKYERGDNYPLISSSYANTKVQSGSNSYNINNHRPYHQETATKVSISTATRKVYYPKSTSTTTTTTTTMKPTTTSTTTTTTTTTTPKPVEKKTTPVKPTRPPTTTTTTTRAPSTTTTTTTTTTTQAPSTQPKVTTWKPSKPSTTRYDEYEGVLPIEKIQGSKYDTPDKFGNYPMTDKDQNGHSNGPQSPPRVIVQTNYDYNDGYDDYDSSPEERPLVPPPPPPQQPVDHYHLRPHVPQPPPNRNTEIVQSIELEFPSTSYPSTTNPPPTTTTPTTTITSAPATSPSHYHHQQQPISGIHLTSDRPPMMVPIHPQPVTSMPLDYGNSHLHVPPVHENFVEGQRPVEFYNNNNNNAHNNVNNNNNNNNNNVGHSGVHFPGNMYGRPGSVISVLPESTSNVIVPHDQDTVSFVLGNRQNVEGSYYTHGTAMEEHPYAPNSNENNFRPIFGSGSSNVQQPGQDQKVSVAMPSVAVVEPSIATSYNTQNWYNPSSNQGPVKSTPMTDGDAQNTKTVQSSFVFPSPSGNENNNKQDTASQTEEVPAPGFVNFPDGGSKDRNDEHNQRPVEEHIIVINQADGSIKEITPNGSNNFADNAVVINGGNNNRHPEGNNNNNNANNPNLPQLSESLTPPAEMRPSRPPPGGISQRPPYYFHYQHGGAPNSGKPSEYPPRPQRIPLPPRQKPEPPPVGFKRRPTPHDPKLPNILPQFRPNAKTSHGHRGTDKIGTLPAPQNYPPNRSRPPTPQSPPPHLHPSRRPQSHPPNSPPPPHFHRLSPPPPPQGHPPNSHPPPHHHNQQQQQPPQVLRKKEDIGGPVAPLPLNPEHLKRFRPPLGGRLAVQKLRMEDEITGDRFSAEPPQIPPRPIIFPKNRADNQMPKVSTLQMIQQRGGLDEEIIRSNLPPLFKINRSDEKSEENDENSTSANEADRRKAPLGDSDVLDGSSASEQGPVYVVYPVNSAVNIGSQEDMVERDETVVIGTRGPHRPLPPDTLPLHDEDDIDRKDGEEGYYYGKRPQHLNNVNGDYASQGYPIDRPESSHLIREKPLLVPSEDLEEDSEDDHKPEESNSSDSSFNVISYLQDFLPFPTRKQQSATISATLPRLPIIASSSPIAYVYTPTTPSTVHRHDLHLDEDDDDDFLRIDHRNEKPVLLPSQQPSSSSSSAPSPQNFMAPFVASVSAEMPSKNNWSVVGLQVNGTERTNDDKKDKEEKVASEKIGNSSDSQENDTQTERVDSGDNFDPENFKPQLFGGFKPIYEFPVDEDDSTAMVGRGVVSRSEVQVNADAGRKLEK